MFITRRWVGVGVNNLLQRLAYPISQVLKPFVCKKYRTWTELSNKLKTTLFEIVFVQILRILEIRGYTHLPVYLQGT
jgi:hypothetical protein